MADPGAKTEAQPVVLGPHGEPCEACGAPLASDQRYCLNCGARRAGPRVDYRTYMSASAAANGAQPAEGAPTPTAEDSKPGEGEKKERDFAPLAAVGGIAVLGLMLLVGVLIGQGNNDPAPASAPVVIDRGGEEAAGAGTTGAAGETGGAKAKPGTTTKAKGKKGGTSAAAAPPPSSTSDLEELNGQSGSSYEEESKNLPNEIATPGTPPPIDKSTAPGGGEGGGVTIK